MPHGIQNYMSIFSYIFWDQNFVPFLDQKDVEIGAPKRSLFGALLRPERPRNWCPQTAAFWCPFATRMASQMVPQNGHFLVPFCDQNSLAIGTPKRPLFGTHLPPEWPRNWYPKTATFWCPFATQIGRHWYPNTAMQLVRNADQKRAEMWIKRAPQHPPPPSTRTPRTPPRPSTSTYFSFPPRPYFFRFKPVFMLAFLHVPPRPAPSTSLRVPPPFSVCKGGGMRGGRGGGRARGGARRTVERRGGGTWRDVEGRGGTRRDVEGRRRGGTWRGVGGEWTRPSRFFCIKMGMYCMVT